MKILLLGEYSKLHNSLKVGLTELGHQVTLVGTGDGFKNFPVDFSIAPKWTTTNSILKFFNKITIRLFKWNLQETEKGVRFYLILPKLFGFDHVQLINSNAIETHPRWSKFLLKKLFKKTKNVNLLICGDENPVTLYYLKKKMRYSVLTPYFENEQLKDYYYYVLKYTQQQYRKLFDFVAQQASVLITSDMDYKIPMEAMGYNSYLIANPIVLHETLPKISLPTDKVIIFLGVNRLSAIKKGVPFFKKAVATIAEKYPNRVEVRVTENLPYKEYIRAYQEAHIFLDMVYAYDQGYNALEAMAQGKVVFTGAEQEFLTYYHLQEDEVCINALPDVDYLVKKMSELIEYPERIKQIGENAQNFIKKEHHYLRIAQSYLNAWKS